MKLVDANTVELNATFTEPNTNSDGTPLLDLDYSTIYIITPAGTIKAPLIQESNASGGGIQTVKIMVNAPSGVKTTLQFAATSTDTTGNEGQRTPEVTVVIDRIAPSVPTNFTLA